MKYNKTEESYFPCPSCGVGEVEKIGQEWVCSVCCFQEDDHMREASEENYCTELEHYLVDVG